MSSARSVHLSYEQAPRLTDCSAKVLPALCVFCTHIHALCNVNQWHLWLQVDERMAVAREVTALRSSGTPGGSGANSPTAAMILANASGSRESLAEMVATHARLFRQGSMNLPKPEDSGVPATHPDMCILRIRRQHLLEVRLLMPSRQIVN